MSSPTSTAIPPLYGDAQGHYRIHLLGNCGTGKSTLGRTLSALLHIPLVSLDTIYFTPGWNHLSTSDFRRATKERLDAAERDDGGWIVDGAYTSQIGGLLKGRATDIIWLDPPLILYFPRLLLRTILGLPGLRPPNVPGCPERFWHAFFAKEGILWWCISRHGPVRQRLGERMQVEGVREDSEEIDSRKKAKAMAIGHEKPRRMRRLGGWGGEVRRWLEDVRRIVEQKEK
ncbi:hypothetical protein C8F01DRAFT_1171748 [Mycena amicta]|nr:hypothetical protein C8F01DRAFT_1171748 [Mycena amicta]